MANTLLLQGVLIASIAVLLIRHLLLRKSPPKNLPPGPKPLPLIGNMLDLPPAGTAEFSHWLKHRDAYGPVSTVSVLGQRLVFLHDRRAAQELLEKRSLRSSGRPVMEFANYCGFGDFLTQMQLSEPFKHQRKLFHQTMGTKALAAKYAPVQEVEVRRLLLRTLKEPEKILKHYATEAGAIILKIVYGYTIEPHKPDPLIGLIGRMMVNFSRVTVPFTQLFEFIPALKLLPEGFPGTTFKTTARLCDEEIRAVLDIPYDFVRAQMAAGAAESYVSRLVRDSSGSGSGSGDDKEPSPFELKHIKLSAGAMYGGGADTTVSTLMAFTLAMTLHPDAQRKAQAEIDRVTGGGARLPTLDDRDSMPYVEAMTSEALRWFPILPLGFPHATTEDMSYEGLDIPAGSYLIPSVWWMTHDPAVYPDPDAFLPERFLSPRNEPDPRSAVFGYGRRVCPGRFLADSSVFLTIAHLLAAFDIRKATDAQGRDIEPVLAYEPGIISKPKEFPFSIVPRSERHAEMVRRIERELPWEESHSSMLGKIPSPSN